MAVVSNSDNENMADDEFDDFTVSNDDLFFEDNDGNTEAILTKDMKNLKISETSKPITYPYDDVYDFCKDSMDSSNDDNNATGATAMTVESEEESEMEVNLYWTKINIDKLRGLGSPTTVLFSDTDSMPDLEKVSDSEDSIVFVFSGSGTSCTNDSENKRNLALFSDEEMTILDKDNGEEGLTTFDAAMLVNIEGNVEGTQMELYDSGASRYMFLYRDHFENYVFIAPKQITAADKHYFQAIGKGDLCIKIPNGSNQTTILLKDVLHCPDMGLTLISIGKITRAGYKVIFKGSICRIYNTKDKVIGQIMARNGLYQVDHEVLVNTAMAGDAQEILTIEELHRCLGHIAPEAAKKMVSSGTVEGLEVDLTSTLQTCDSCEYAKATQKPIKKF